MMKYYYYLEYVLKHKWFVFVECRKAGIFWRGLLHDLSKFRPSEFIPYARYFYGKYPDYEAYEGTTVKRPRFFKEDIQRRFDRAWLKHIHRNPHHWQYWILQEDDGPQKLIPIPPKILIEMVCDWHGAGKAITGEDNIEDWYQQNKDKIMLNRINRKFVEKKIGLKDDALQPV